ncbi:MAG: FemAB family PEP-CTERM system-associated protein [Gammaproteobacteria bacterium]|nr:FemAB family PEP-CTERM system-associated protein [Gammaproteobacteria bacterium]
MTIRIERYTRNDLDKWDKFLYNQPDSNFYQLSDWKQINESCFNHKCYYLGAEKNGEILGVFPVVFINSLLFGKIMTSMPFVNFGSICSISDEISQLLLDEATTIAREVEADYVEIRGIDKVSESLPTVDHKISMTLDLKPDPDEIWNAFKSKHRTNIRRVYKENITVKHGREELLDTFYSLMSQSWKSLGTPIYRKSYFRKILQQFPDETLIFVAYKDDIPVATAFNGYYKDTVEGMWAGTIPNTRKIQPNYVLYWEMIKHACLNGYNHFHLGRSTADSGAETFKKKWNAYGKRLHWQYILNKQQEVPQLNVNNPKFALAIKAWRKLPLKITTTIGPYIAKNIP